VDAVLRGGYRGPRTTGPLDLKVVEARSTCEKCGEYGHVH
jgi:hypothetical protein